MTAFKAIFGVKKGVNQMISPRELNLIKLFRRFYSKKSKQNPSKLNFLYVWKKISFLKNMLVTI